MNKVILIGNLTRAPESGATTNGHAWCRFTLAVDRRYTDQSGQRQTDFFNIVVWRTLAESCMRYLAKGRKACVIGHIENRQYDDETGQRRYTTEIIADDVEFLGSRPGTDSAPE